MRMAQVISVAIVAGFATTTMAQNSIVIESRSVTPGTSQVQIGVHLENDADIMGIVLPLELRSLSGSAFIESGLTIQPQGRISQLQAGITATYTFGNKSTALDVTTCGLDSNGYVWAKDTAGADYSSPDALLYAAISTDDTLDVLAGSDGVPGSGAPSLLIQFDVSSAEGQFEIDTVCIPQDNHLLFIHSPYGETTVAPAFTKGVITVADSCACNCHTDPQCNGYHDIVDYILVRDVANGSHAPIPDSNAFCPVQTTDVNCDGVTNVADRTLMYSVVFLGENPDSVFCNPCP